MFNSNLIEQIYAVLYGLAVVEAMVMAVAMMLGIVAWIWQCHGLI